MRTKSIWAALFCFVALPAWAQEAAKSAMPNNAVLVGWDGAHRDHIKALLKEGRLPNLRKLVGEGMLVDIEVTSGATDTKAGWSQILTGYRPEVTGVYSNGRFRDIPAGYSVFERLRAQYGADKIATVAVIGKQWHCGEIDAPFKRPYDPAKDDPAAQPAKKGKGQKKQPGAKGQNRGRVVEEGGAKYVVFGGSPYYTMHNNVDQWRFGLTQDDKVGDTALEMLDKYGKRALFFFVHFAEVDHSGHRHGEKSKEYDDAIISGDQQLGRIVEKLKQLGVYDKTLLYVTADHGFDIDDTRHRQAPYVFLATNDKKVMRGGSRADITPTILDRLGVDLAKITPPLDGESLARPATKAPTKPDIVPKPRKKKKAAAVTA
jgi:predicted AlkP superfamily pyrophosphatase or phosphodiesterase